MGNSAAHRTRLGVLIAVVLLLPACSGVSVDAAGSSAATPTDTPPAITTQPASQTLIAGQSATFTISAVGTPPLGYGWQKNGVAIVGATANSYSTGPTTASDNGTVFTATVSNVLGAATSNAATLTVTVPVVAPVIMSEPQNATVTVGQPATFIIVATGSAPLLYQWKRNGVAISGATTASYSIGATSATDNGATFDVTVSNAGGTITSTNASLTVTKPATTPFGHVVIVVEENANYSTVVGNTAEMPYLNSLIAQYGLATQYYANAHPSISDYFMLVTGQILTSDDSQTPATFPVSVDNAVREVLAAGKTWKAYAEDLPSVGYLGGDSGAYYLVRHVPMAYLTDVQDSATNRQRLVPFTQFATDLAAGQLPNYSFITPNACDDAHSCPLANADSWLQANIAPLLSSTSFKNDGLLIITFDESGNDDTNGGGRIATVLISPAYSKAGYQSTTLYQHQSTLRLMLQGLGITTLPGAAATAPSMWEFFTFPPPP